MKLGYSQGQLVVREAGSCADRRLPFCNVDSLNVFGSPQLSTQLIRECLSSATPVGYYTEDGHYLGRVVSPGHADPFRQKGQILLTDDESFCLVWSKLVVEAKLQNSLAFLLSMRDVYGFSDEELLGIRHSLKHIDAASSVEELLGFEGNAAKCYFSCYSKLFSDCDLSFKGRSSRPPKDEVNALLSYGYSILHRGIVGAIERHGLHPYFGFMHKIQRGHASLASDLMEDYRSFVVDRSVLSFVRFASLSAGDFSRSDNGAVFMSKSTMKAFTNFLSEEMSGKNPFFKAYGDNFMYGFHAALDKKMASVIAAIDAGNPLLYRPFVWVFEDRWSV